MILLTELIRFSEPQLKPWNDVRSSTELVAPPVTGIALLQNGASKCILILHQLLKLLLPTLLFPAYIPIHETESQGKLKHDIVHKEDTIN